jgi:predicted HTH transcriptional regulator
MASKELVALIYYGSEERNLEYKTSMNWNTDETKTKLAKSIMAMANIKDGGAIILGVTEEAPGKFVPTGMSEEDERSFNQDSVSEYVNKYADPFVELKVEKHIEGDKRFVIVQVQEFEELPVVCKKDHSGVLKRGDLYTRSRHKHESVQVPSQTEMREILDMAVDKRMQRRIELFHTWGVTALTPQKDIDAGKFHEQIKDLEG